MYKFDTLLYDWSSIVNTGSTNSLILVFFVLHFAANKNFQFNRYVKEQNTLIIV